MAWIKLFEDFNEVDALCKKWGIRNYTINPDGSVDVDGNVDLINLKLKKIPIKFGVVSGYFDCGHNQLTTLEGAPREVGNYFYCINNKLTTLEGSPKEVGGSFDCAVNQLTTLQGAPKEVRGNFWCNNNQLATLEGASKRVGGGFYFHGNPKLPEEIKNDKDIKYILYWQEEYGIWQGGKLNLYRFKEMMKDYELD